MFLSASSKASSSLMVTGVGFKAQPLAQHVCGAPEVESPDSFSVGFPSAVEAPLTPRGSAQQQVVVEASGGALVQTAAPVAETTAVNLALTPLSRQEMSNAISMRLLARRLAPDLSSAVLEQLKSNPDLAGVLCGVMNSVSLPMEGAVADQMAMFVRCHEMVTKESLAAIPDPHKPGHLLILNNVNMNMELPEVRWGLRLVPQSWTEEAAAKAEQMNEKGRAEGRACLQASLGPADQRQPTPRTPGQVAMISYVDNPEQLGRFAEVLQEWKTNLSEFGHHHVRFQLCDDSPEPYASQMRALLQQADADGPVGFSYLGSSEKEAARRKLEKRLGEVMTAEEASQVAFLVAGSGATQNRNFSLQMLGPGGGLQMDHDMTPEMLTKHNEKPLPFDIMGSLESVDRQHSISSFGFTGSADVSIDTILAEPLPNPDEESWQEAESRDPVSPYKVPDRYTNIFGSDVRGPMFVPSNVSQAARIAPGLRDGDLALGTFSERIQGYGSSSLGQHIYHRDAAGSRWGGAQLLRQYLLYEFVDAAVKQAVPEVDDPRSAREVGELILAGLDGGKAVWPSVTESACFQRCDKALPKYLSEREKASLELGGLLDRLNGGEAEEVAGLWAGRDVSAEEVPVIQAELLERLGRVRADMQAMRDKLHLGSDGKPNADLLNLSLKQEATAVLKTQALALIHSDLIAAELEALRCPPP